jgi:2-methylcitrate dehydratase PrpD
MTTALEQLGAFVARYTPDRDTTGAVRLHVADTIGAWIAAGGTAEGRALLAFGRPDAGVVDRITLRVALARLSEVDDIHLGSMITPGAIVVPSSLAIAASLPDCDADAVAAAVVCGYEAMIRLGAAIDGPSVLYRGIWPTFFAAPFGVAAAAARLLKLSETESANALSIALIMATPGTGHHAAVTTARWLAVGQAAARGYQAALAAQAGFTSDVKIADGDFLKNIYGLAPDAAVLGRGFREPALRQVSFKPWCAARQTMAATQALKEILDAGIAPDAIARIGVAVLPPHLKMIDHGVTAGDRFSHLTSVQYQMAVAALAPDRAFRLSGPADALPPELAAFMSRIQVRAEPALLGAGYPQAWPAHITVTASGRYERTVAHVPGDPARPFGENELKTKFLRVVAPLLEGGPAISLFEGALAALHRPAGMVRTIEEAGRASR